MAECPKPTSHKDLQQFLGFMNFYHRFIRDYSRVATPLTWLTSPALPFLCTPKLRPPSMELKRHITSTPILVQPDPSKQFIVEVDTSDCSVGAILSQHSEPDQKLHPCVNSHLKCGNPFVRL